MTSREHASAIGDAFTSVSSLEEIISKLSDENEALEKRVSKLEQDVDGRDETIASLEEMIEELKKGATP